jgi:hypothetical protein
VRVRESECRTVSASERVRDGEREMNMHLMCGMRELAVRIKGVRSRGKREGLKGKGLG